MLSKLLKGVFARKPAGGPRDFADAQAQSSEAREWFRKGVSFSAAGDIDRARDCYERAIEIDPRDGQSCNNLGIIAQRRGERSAAKAYFQRATVADPALPQPHVNLANLLQDDGALEDALEKYGAALRLAPDLAEARYGRSTTLLALGRFEEGWKEYEWRWHVPGSGSRIRNFVEPRWSGKENVHDQTVLVYEEQGYGDVIQFMRYAPMLATRCARVIIECRAELLPLLRTLRGGATLVATDTRLPPFDFQIPVMSLPLAFGTRAHTIPADVPYLFADEAKVSSFRGRNTALGDRACHVGLAWRGDPRFWGAAEKACPVEYLLPLLDAGDCIFHSLQKPAIEADLNTLKTGGRRILNHADSLQDFGDTAALVQCLDIVITVDTAVAHVAGALGKEVWMLLPFSTDWRWLQSGERSPWYPTMRLLRQPAPGKWEAAVGEARNLLSARLASGRRISAPPA
jgi:tetratricopeptide (TPR) repeat protein